MSLQNEYTTRLVRSLKKPSFLQRRGLRAGRAQERTLLRSGGALGRGWRGVGGVRRGGRAGVGLRGGYPVFQCQVGNVSEVLGVARY